MDHPSSRVRVIRARSGSENTNVSSIQGSDCGATILDFRRLRDRDYCADDPLACRVLNVRRLPDVATIGRTIASADAKSALNLRKLVWELVLDRLTAIGLARVTIDFDGSVLSTTRRAVITSIDHHGDLERLPRRVRVGVFHRRLWSEVGAPNRAVGGRVGRRVRIGARRIGRDPIIVPLTLGPYPSAGRPLETIRGGDGREAGSDATVFGGMVNVKMRTVSYGVLVLLACASACSSDGGDGRRDPNAPGGIVTASATETDTPGSGTSGGDESGPLPTSGTTSATTSSGSQTSNVSAAGSGPVFDVGAGTGGAVACEVQSPEITILEPTLVFVLDKSGSMSNSQFDTGMGTVSRWNALHDTVTFLLNTYAAQVQFGMKLFPSANGCNVDAGLDVAPAFDNGAAILGAMPGPGADLNNGGTSQTPVQQGMERAGAVVETYDATKPRGVLLVLDGGVSTTCTGNTAAGTEAEIARLWNDGIDGIPTYVVGVDISSGVQDDMNAYAEAGGVPTGNPGDAVRFYNAVDTMELEAAMETIIGDLLSCDIDLDPAPEHPDLTEVSVDGTDYSQVSLEACDAGTDGWIYSIEHTQIRLCGAACSAFEDVQAAQVDFFCPAG